jgi:hypothetical protein
MQYEDELSKYCAKTWVPSIRTILELILISPALEAIENHSALTL